MFFSVVSVDPDDSACNAESESVSITMLRSFSPVSIRCCVAFIRACSSTLWLELCFPTGKAREVGGLQGNLM